MLHSRNNAGVVTLNLPRISIESKGSKEVFWKILTKRLDIAHEALNYRINRVMQGEPTNCPILYKNGVLARLKDTDDISELYKNGRATISLGYIGLYETVAMFFGEHWQVNGNTEAKEFSLEIMNYLADSVKQWREKEGFWYSLYSTPSESLTDTFLRKDREKFGIIKGVTNKDYYTNSFHVNVQDEISPFEKIDFESVYQPIASGGFIS